MLRDHTETRTDIVLWSGQNNVMPSAKRSFHRRCVPNRQYYYHSCCLGPQGHLNQHLKARVIINLELFPLSHFVRHNWINVAAAARWNEVCGGRWTWCMVWGLGWAWDGWLKLTLVLLDSHGLLDPTTKGDQSSSILISRILQSLKPISKAFCPPC